MPVPNRPGDGHARWATEPGMAAIITHDGCLIRRTGQMTLAEAKAGNAHVTTFGDGS